MIAAIPAINFLVEVNMNISLPQWLSGLDERIKEAEMNYSYAKNFLLGKYEISEFWFNLAGIRNYFTVSEINKTLATYMGQL